MDLSSQLFFLTIFFTATFVAILLYRWHLLKKHCRERFAFYSLRTFVGFLLVAVPLIFGRDYLISLQASYLGNYLNIDLSAIQPVAPATAIGIVFAAALMIWALIYLLYRNWNGPVSKRQVNLQELGQPIGLIMDHQFYQKHRDDIEIHEEKEKRFPEVFSATESDTRAWHRKAANLFSLLDQQYHIEEEQWYEESQYYLSNYGLDRELILIYCPEKAPSRAQLRTFLDRTASTLQKCSRIIIASPGYGEQKSEHFDQVSIEYRYESEMLDKLLPINRYRSYITKYFNSTPIGESEFRLADMYVPLGGHTRKIVKGKLEKDQDVDAVEAYVLDWIKGKYRRYKNEHLVLLGNYGQGKTVLTHKIVKEMLEHPEAYDRIPILIELRGSSPRNEDDLSLFSRWANRFQAKAEALWELHRAGKLLIILDGFDEMDLVGDTHILYNHFTQLWALARTPNAQLIIAGRPTLFADDEERRAALGIHTARTDLPYAQPLYLDQLTPTQIRRVLRGVQTSTQTEILNALESSGPESSFAELASRPSTLFQLSLVWDQELAQQKHRLNSATVIGSFIEKMYNRQQQKESTFLTSFERNYFMMGIAVAMMLENGYTNQIKHADLKRWIRKLWENYPPKLSPTRDAMQSTQTLDYLPIRLKDNKDALATILRDVRVGGILVQDPSGRDLFRFAHKSHLEYLVSAYYSGYILKNERNRSLMMMVNGITSTTQFNQAKFITTIDVERFTAELIAAAIEVTDNAGHPLSIKENASQYEQALFDGLNPFSAWPTRKITDILARLTGWLTLHPDQKWYMAITLISISCIVIYNFATTELKVVLAIINTLSCWFWVRLLLSYRQDRERLQNPPSPPFLTNMKVYDRALGLLKYPKSRFSKNYHLFLKSNKTSLSQVIPILLSYFILLAGSVSVATGFLATDPEAYMVSITLQDGIEFLIKDKVLSVSVMINVLGIAAVYIISMTMINKSKGPFFWALLGGYFGAIALAALGGLAGMGAFARGVVINPTNVTLISNIVGLIITATITIWIILRIQKEYKKAFSELSNQKPIESE